jgi:hypothetical protein
MKHSDQCPCLRCECSRLLTARSRGLGRHALRRNHTATHINNAAIALGIALILAGRAARDRAPCVHAWDGALDTDRCAFCGVVRSATAWRMAGWPGEPQ